MANKYLDKSGLQRVAEYVNAKLTFCTTMPASPKENQLVLYIGDTTASYFKGGIYKYDGSKWQLQNLAKAIDYVTTLPSSNIDDVIYGVKGYVSSIETIADGFLDDNDMFEKNPGTGDDYSYVPVSGLNIEASEDGVDYLGFVSLEYDGTSDWTLTYDDESTVTLADGDEIHFRKAVTSFYAGDATEQKILPLGSSGGGGGSYVGGEGVVIDGVSISLKPATTTSLGGVKPDGDTLSVDTNGVLSGNYKGGYGINVDEGEISTKAFVGTQAEWNNLTSSQKAKFDVVNITDDGITPNSTPGHEILDAEGTALPQRTSLTLEGAVATDDSTNDTTKITITPYVAGEGIDIDEYEVSVTEDRPATFVGTTQEWDSLTAAEKAQYKIVNLTNDVAGGEMVVVDAIEDGNANPVSSQGVFNELGGYIDITGIPANALIDDLITSVTSKGMRPYSASILSFGSGTPGPSVAPVISTLTGGSGLRYFCIGLNISSTVSVFAFSSDAVIRVYFRK